MSDEVAVVSQDQPDGNPPKRPNRPNKKKRKKFMANARGFAKQGIYGRGAHIEQDQWSYFVNIMDKIREGFESLDDKVTMANNVFEQTDGHEILLSSNQVACKAVEYLLPFVDAPHLERFHTAFGADLRPLCSDRFATHVLQKLVEISAIRTLGFHKVSQVEETEEDAKTSTSATAPKAKKRRMNNIPTEKEYNLTEGLFNLEHANNCDVFLKKVSKFLLNNLEDFVWDQYGNHVMRTCLLCLGGVFVEKDLDQMQYNDKSRNKIAVEKEQPLCTKSLDWSSIAEDFASRLQDWPQFKDLPYEELPSALLQVLCISLRSSKSELKSLGKKLLNESFLAVVDAKPAIKEEEFMEHKSEDVKMDEEDEDNDDSKSFNKATTQETEQESLPKGFSTESSVRLIEVLLEVSGRKLFTQLYAQLFSSRLQQLAMLPSVNFTVQRLLDNVREKSEFEAMYDELSPKVLDLLKIGHTGVVYSIASACQRLTAKQGAFIQSIQTALDAAGSKEKTDKFFLLVLKLKPYSVAKEDHSNFIHLHGSLILQAMLQFNKPIKLVQNILDARNDMLADIFCTPQGSHVADVFLASKFIGEKSREKLIKHMEGTYMQLALSRNGSRVIEAIFAAAGPQQKARIVKELADKMNQLQSSPSGRLLIYKFKVSAYQMSPEKWKAALDRGSQVQKVFKEFV